MLNDRALRHLRHILEEAHKIGEAARDTQCLCGAEAQEALDQLKKRIGYALDIVDEDTDVEFQERLSLEDR